MYCINSLRRKGAYVHWIDVQATKKDAPCLLLFHGTSDNGFSWSKQIEFLNKELKNKFYIIAPSMHGSLNHEKVKTKRIHTQELIKDITSILDNIDSDHIRPIYIVGHDLGAFLSVALLEKLSDRVKGIIHINGMGLKQYMHRKFSIKKWLKSYLIILYEFTPIKMILKLILSQTLCDRLYDFTHDSGSNPLFQDKKSLSNNLALYKMLFLRIFHYIGLKVKKIETPTLFLWANKNVFFSPPTLKEINLFYKNADIRFFEGDHNSHKSESSSQVNFNLKSTLIKWQNIKKEKTYPKYFTKDIRI